MDNATKEGLKNIVVTTATGLGGIAATKAFDKVYEETTKEAPPQVLSDRRNSLAKVLAYTVAISLAMGITRLLL